MPNTKWWAANDTHPIGFGRVIPIRSQTITLFPGPCHRRPFLKSKLRRNRNKGNFHQTILRIERYLRSKKILKELGTKLHKMVFFVKPCQILNSSWQLVHLFWSFPHKLLRPLGIPGRKGVFQRLNGTSLGHLRSMASNRCRVTRGVI